MRMGFCTSRRCGTESAGTKSPTQLFRDESGSGSPEGRKLVAGGGASVTSATAGFSHNARAPRPGREKRGASGGGATKKLRPVEFRSSRARASPHIGVIQGSRFFARKTSTTYRTIRTRLLDVSFSRRLRGACVSIEGSGGCARYTRSTDRLPAFVPPGRRSRSSLRHTTSVCLCREHRSSDRAAYSAPRQATPYGSAVAGVGFVSEKTSSNVEPALMTVSKTCPLTETSVVGSVAMAEKPHGRFSVSVWRPS